MLHARALRVGHPGSSPTPPLDIEIGRGEWIALSGPNGAGKSALLLTLAGLLEPRGGDLLWRASAAPAGAAGQAAGIALQNAESQLLTDTVAHELALPLENLGWSRERIDTRVAALLDEFELRPLAERSLHRLSGGEQARLAVACAAAALPELLLLDEPGASMDARGRRRLLDWLGRWVQGGRSLVVATQLREEWHAASRRLWLGADGRAEAARRWFDEPATPAPAPDELSYYARRPENPAPPVLLETIGVSYRHAGASADAWVIRDARLELRRGETVLVRGPNGSGKTTLLHLLAGLVDPHDGRVRPSPLLLARAERGRLGVLLQNPEDQIVGATVLADLCLGEHRPDAAARQRAQLALAATGLSADFLERAPGECSVGERRRVAWAGLLLLDAALWLLDEPTAGLDEDGLHVLVRSIKQFNREGGTVVLATQDERLTAILCAEHDLVGPCSVQVTGAGSSAPDLKIGQNPLDLDRT